MNLKTRIVFTLLAIALAGSAFAGPAAPAASSTHQSTSAPNADGPAAPPAKASDEVERGGHQAAPRCPRPPFSETRCRDFPPFRTNINAVLPKSPSGSADANRHNRHRGGSPLSPIKQN